MTLALNNNAAACMYNHWNFLALAALWWEQNLNARPPDFKLQCPTYSPYWLVCMAKCSNTGVLCFSPVADYSVRIKTGNVKNAGTDSNIYLQVFGDKGDTGIIELKQICDTKDKFQRGSNTKINLQTVDVGNVSWCMLVCLVLRFCEATCSLLA